jgi:hypothetical protein
MTAIIRDLDGHITNDEDVQGRLPDGENDCCVCGRPANAVWTAGPSILICCVCAVDVLPKLIADAVAGGGVMNTVAFRHIEGEMLLNYWRAVANAMEVRHRYRMLVVSTHRIPQVV